MDIEYIYIYKVHYRRYILIPYILIYIYNMYFKYIYCISDKLIDNRYKLLSNFHYIYRFFVEIACVLLVSILLIFVV